MSYLDALIYRMCKALGVASQVYVASRAFIDPLTCLHTGSFDSNQRQVNLEQRPASAL